MKIHNQSQSKFRHLTLDLFSLVFFYLVLGVDKEIFERIKGIPNLDKNCYIAINSLNNSDTPPEYEYKIQEDPNPNPNPEPNSDESLNPSGRHKFICILKIMGQEFFGEGKKIICYNV